MPGLDPNNLLLIVLTYLLPREEGKGEILDGKLNFYEVMYVRKYQTKINTVIL